MSNRGQRPGEKNDGVLNADGISAATLLSGVAKSAGGRQVAIAGRVSAVPATRNEAYFQILFEQALDALIVLGPSGEFVDANPAACQLIGLAKSELMGRSVAETIETSTNFAIAWNKFLNEGLYRGQRWLVRPDGARRLIEIRATAHVLPGRHFAIWRDVTDRYFLDSELVQRERDQAIARLAGGIAHDFTNLLHVIGGHAELLARDVASGSELHLHLDRILSSTRHAAALTSQLSALGRQQVLSPAVFDLSAFVNSCGETLHRLLPETVELVLPETGKPASIRADRTQMAQVLFMMVSSAGERVNRGGRLTIAVNHVQLAQDLTRPGLRVPAGEYVSLELRTSASGEESQQKLSGTQPHVPSAPRSAGEAMPAVSATVRQNGGFLWLATDRTAGATFRIYFPRAEGTGASHPQPARNLGGNEIVLLAEDDPAIREATREYLKCLGYRVLRAADGEEAMAAARSVERVDALIADLAMPKMGGKELADKLAASMPAMKVMFVSGNLDREFIPRENVDGAPVLLSKPFAMRVLATKLRDLLDGRAADDAPSS